MLYHRAVRQTRGTSNSLMSHGVGAAAVQLSVTSGLVLLRKIRVDPNSAKRQKRQELKRAAEWENATGVMKGNQAALEKAVRQGHISAKQSKACAHYVPTFPSVFGWSISFPLVLAGDG